MNTNQGVLLVPKAPQRKPSQLEEYLTKYMKVTQVSFEQVGKNQEALSKSQETMSKNTEASVKKIRNENR